MMEQNKPKRWVRPSKEENNMTTQNVKTLGGEVGAALTKGKMAEGEIIRITIGEASDFMTPEQTAARKVAPNRAFVEMEIIEPESGTIFSKTFPLYEGVVPANSIQGQLIRMYGPNLAEDGKINLVTKEVNGRDGRAFVVWDIVV